MISFDLPGGHFKLRVAAVCLLGGHVLLQGKNLADTHWILPGGRIEFHENSASALRRELMEELRCDAHIERLLWVTESFYSDGTLDSHELLFVYRAHLSDLEHLGTNRTYSNLDGGLKIIFKWFPLHRPEK